MAVNFSTGGSGQHLEATSAAFPGGTSQITLACWVRPLTNTGPYGVLTVSQGGTNGGYLALGLGGSVGAGTGFLEVSGDAVGTSGTITNGVWHHLCGVYNVTGTGSQSYVYTDGVAGVLSASIGTVATAVNRTTLGALQSSGGWVANYNGDLAECAAWTVALTADEVMSLAKGMSPLHIRPASLTMYAPLVLGGTNPEQDWVGQRSFAAGVNGVSGATSHPPVRPRRSPLLRAPKTTATPLVDDFNSYGTFSALNDPPWGSFYGGRSSTSEFGINFYDSSYQNYAEAPGGGTWASAALWDYPAPDDQRWEFVVLTNDGGDWYAYVRAQGATNNTSSSAMLFGWDSATGQFKIERQNTGSYTVVATVPGTDPGPEDSVALQAVGHTFKFEIDYGTTGTWTTIWEGIDTSAPSTGGSFVVESNGIFGIDNVSLYPAVADPVVSVHDLIMSYTPRGYWRCNVGTSPAVGTTVPDVSGNGLNLATWNNSIAGWPHDSTSLIDTDGTDPAISLIPDSNVWSATQWPGLTLTSGMTVQFWMRPDSTALSGTAYRDVVVKGDAGGGVANMLYGVRINPSGGNYVLYGGITQSTGTTVGISSGSLQDGRRYHVALTYDSATGALRLYVDGQQISSTFAATNSIKTQGTNFVFGQYNASTNGYSGILDEVAIFDHALTPAQVKALYDAGMQTTLAKTILNDSPWSYYRLDDPFADSSGNNRDLRYDTPTHTTSQASIVPTEAVDGAQHSPGFAGLASDGTAFTPTRMSIEAWFKPDVIYGCGIASKGHHKIFMRTTGVLVAQFDLDTTGNSWWVDGATASTGTLYHVVGTYDGTNVRLYVNGTQSAISTNHTGIVASDAGNLRVFNDDGSNYPTAAIDEVAFYNYALSPAQVAAHYAAGVTTSGGPTDHPLTLTTTITTTPLIVRASTRTLARTITTTPLLTKTAAKTLSRSITSTPILQKDGGKRLTVTVNNTSTLSRSAGKVLARSITTTPVIVKAAAKTLARSVTASPSLNTGGAFSFFQTLNVTVNTTATLSKVITRALSTTVTTSPRITKNPGKTASATVNTTAAMTRAISRIITLPVNVNTSASMSRAVTKSVNASIITTPRIAKSFPYTLSTTIHATPSLTKTPGKVFQTNVTSSVAPLGKAVGKNINAPITSISFVGKAATKTITKPITVLAQLSVVRRGSETPQAHHLKTAPTGPVLQSGLNSRPIRSVVGTAKVRSGLGKRPMDTDFGNRRIR